MAQINPEIKKLRAKFVCVRLVQMNGVDLRIFHFNFDLSWTLFFLSPDLEIYGRYGSRTYGKDTESCVTLNSLKKAMKLALDLHKNYPMVKDSLKGKKISKKKWKWRTPESIPALKQKMKQSANWKKPFPANCIHCHNVTEAISMTAAMQQKPVPDTSIWPYPFPEAIGLTIDIDDGTLVSKVTKKSPASKAGVKIGDVVETMNGQPIISIADIQWVLHNAPGKTVIKMGVMRGKEKKNLSIKLKKKWRRSRHTWGGLGRANLQPEAALARVPNAEKKKLGLKSKKLAIRFKKVWGQTQKAGFKDNDIIIKAGGRSKDMSSVEFIAFIRQKCIKKRKLPVTVVRKDGKGKNRVYRMVLPLNIVFIKK